LHVPVKFVMRIDRATGVMTILPGGWPGRNWPTDRESRFAFTQWIHGMTDDIARRRGW